MATLTVKEIIATGLDDSLAAADAGGDSFDCSDASDAYFIRVDNGGGGAITVTIDVTTIVSGRSVTDDSGSVGAGASRMFGPISRRVHGDTASITYSGVTSVTVAAFKISKE